MSFTAGRGWASGASGRLPRTCSQYLPLGAKQALCSRRQVVVDPLALAPCTCTCSCTRAWLTECFLSGCRGRVTSSDNPNNRWN